MKEYDDKELEKVERQLMQQFDEIEIPSDEEFLAGIRPMLKKKRKRSIFKSRNFTTRFVAAAVSIFLFVGIGIGTGVTFWFTRTTDTPPDPGYRYSDLDIERKPCEVSDIINTQGLYVPGFEILMNIEYKVGEHKESLEKVYFVVEGMHIDNGVLRQITLTITMQKKREIQREDQYDTDNKITVANREISVLEGAYIEPYYNYTLGFKIGTTRYYFDYQTTSSDKSDIESFMNLFLK